ncbi:uncharacterized protein LOC128185196, partial [Crassostrea angulata]|uniref:uncharacterized protein LOC128185196 n=1 Tax=Magallana angulata TaxID=2784310 RepID=UPI0022B1D8F6
MKRELFLKNTIAALLDRSSYLLDMKRGNTVFTVNQLRRREILSKSMYFVFWILIILDQGDGTTLCTQASKSYSLPVSSLCYQTSASANRVVLDGYLTYQSFTTVCSCTLTSSKSTTVGFKALNNLHPIYAGCGSNILIHTGRTSFSIGCFITGSATVSPTQAVTLNFEKPLDGYNSNYCMLIDSDVNDVVLTLKCDGDLNFPSSTLIPLSTLGTRSTTTTLTSETP